MGTYSQYFEYLDDLRESGEINMFSAPTYLTAVFGITKAEARAVTSEWMNNFKNN